MKKNTSISKIIFSLLLVTFMSNFLFADNGQENLIQEAQTVSWEKDIKLALENGISATPQKMESPFIWLEIMDIPSNISSSLSEIFLKKLSTILLTNRDFILSLSRRYLPAGFSSLDGLAKTETGREKVGFILHRLADEKAPYLPEEIFSIKKNYCLLFNDVLVQKLIMPAIQALLKEEGMKCLDCPGPETSPPLKTIKFSEFMSYIINSYRSFEVDKELNVLIELEPVIEATSNLPAPDLDIALAAFLCIDSNTSAKQNASKMVWKAIGQKAYKKILGQKEKNEFLLSFVREHLLKDTNFINAVKKQMSKALPKLNLIQVQTDNL